MSAGYEYTCIGKKKCCKLSLGHRAPYCCLHGLWELIQVAGPKQLLLVRKEVSEWEGNSLIPQA